MGAVIKIEMMVRFEIELFERLLSHYINSSNFPALLNFTDVGMTFSTSPFISHSFLAVCSWGLVFCGPFLGTDDASCVYGIN